MTLAIGAQAPTFDLSATDGARVSLESLKGASLVAVIFSCNHCPYVQAWEGRMIEIQNDFADRGVQIVAINANDEVAYPEDSLEAMKARAESERFNFPYLRDADQSVAAAFGAQRTPEVFLLGPERRLVYHGAIDDNFEEPENVRDRYLRDAIESALAGEPVSRAETPPVGCTIKWSR